MTRASGDDDLQRLFAELREHDRRAVPPFDALLASAAARTTRRSGQWALRAAAAAGLLLAAGMAGVLLLGRPAAPAAEIAVASWQSPTAILLRVPGENLLRALPSASSSVVNLDAAASLRHRQ